MATCFYSEVGLMVGLHWPKGESSSSDVPVRRDLENVQMMLSRAPWTANVFLPHAVAVIIGLTFFCACLAKAPGFDQLQL
jgi:hypothetical protein